MPGWPLKPNSTVEGQSSSDFRGFSASCSVKMVVGISSGNGRVPSALPPILKNYTKAAIRTQPRDLIAWSFAYFNALSKEEPPPVKDQLEFPLPDTATGISPGLLRVLHKKFGPLVVITKTQLEELCQAMGVQHWAATEAWNSVEGADDDDTRLWTNLLLALIDQEVKGVADKLALVMQAITSDPITRKVPVEEVVSYFDLIHPSEGDSDDEALHQEVTDYLKEISSYQEGFLLPGDLTRTTCPLNKFN